MSSIFILVCLLSCTSSVLSTTQDEHLLLKLKKQLGNPAVLSSWVKGYDFCHVNSNSVRIFCGNNNRVYYLTLNQIDTHAPFPKAICGLTELQYLDITNMPGLVSLIPSCITNLIKLDTIDIRGTSLSGRVPKFSNTTNSKLVILNLSNNRLSGKIPSSLSTLPNIFQLDLSSNYLTGAIPSGMFPYKSSGFFDTHPTLFLHNNNLTGEIPKSYGSMNFYSINVANNQLTGNPSFLFGSQKNTEFISLANNFFEFDLSYLAIPWPLTYLYLNHNKIYGKVPESIAKSNELSSLDLSSNKLCGEIPQGSAIWKSNAAAFANNTCLCGYPLPPCFGSPQTPTAPPTPMLAPYN